MTRKNVFRNLAIVAGFLLVIWLVSYFSNDTRGWHSVDTSVALSQLQDKSNVDSVQIDDKEQQLRITLKNGNDATKGETKLIAKYPGGGEVSAQVFKAAQDSGVALRPVTDWDAYRESH